ncbi:hypothetical protein WOLCODRAFT_109788 [Wolfiporia cocos MD-104 SS10]|uniref:Velvet domain-containing protein n=1 Tax=Wolfiporia cocos (strain MD-104) TaxID=742152 RepID=A0A2H3JC45_WOLCO|nr:hypothetical protein WOLCODRAFT_109788 [Wolfiporia cocos MD-104 SS10]
MLNGTARAHSAGSSQVGGPVVFREGQYAGRTLRAELEELQKADLGRKYARKDRRPLDPPPVVQFRLFEVLDAGTPRQREREFDCHEDLNSFGAMCFVDLYPVPDEDVRELHSGTRLAPRPLHSPHAELPTPPMASTIALHQPAATTCSCSSFPCVCDPSLGDRAAVLTVPAQDLAVKLEGSFVPRYRVFNLSSKASGGTGVPVLAECFGGPFKIYSTKEFPGLRASTDLTKYLSFYGVRLNLRENERKRRKKSEIEAERRENVAAASASAGTSGTDSQAGRSRRSQRKRRAYEYSSDEDDAYIED